MKPSDKDAPGPHGTPDEPVETVASELVDPDSAPDHLDSSDDLPVVARLVVEIRSDGKRTVARGAMEEVTSGQRVAVEARGDSPMQLAWALARSMFAVPSLARKTVRALLPGRRRGRK